MTKGWEDSLLDAIVEYFNLPCVHRKDPVERESILLRTGAEHGTSQLNGLKVVIKRDDYLAPFARFDRVWWSKTAIEGDERQDFERDGTVRRQTGKQL